MKIKCKKYQIERPEVCSIPLKEDDSIVNEDIEKAINKWYYESLKNTDLGEQLDYLQIMQREQQDFCSFISIPTEVWLIRQKSGKSVVHIEFFYKKNELANYDLPLAMGLHNMVEISIDDVGNLYSKIHNQILEEMRYLSQPKPQYMSLGDDVSNLYDILNTMDKFVDWLKNDYQILEKEMIYQLNGSMLDEYIPLYGKRTFSKNAGKIFYDCNNLIQLCFALIDVLLQANTDNRKMERYIEKCKRCGEYFTAKNRKTKLCVECRAKNIAECRKKSKRQSNLGLGKTENKIMTALYDRMTSFCDADKQEAAERLHNLFKSQKTQHKAKKDYEDWLNFCNSYIIKRDYKGLYEWLSREEV